MLKRKIRKVGSSLIVTIPSHLAIAYGYKEDQEVEIQITSQGLLLKNI